MRWTKQLIYNKMKTNMITKKSETMTKNYILEDIKEMLRKVLMHT